MRVFVSGATGVLGRPTVALLVAAGHDVTGVARTPAKRSQLNAAGATPLEVDLFDPEAVMAAVSGHDAVCNLATAIPVGERAGSPSAWEENDRIRRDASRNLVDAALAAGAGRYVQESIAFLYADGGDRVLDESAPVDPSAAASALAAEASAARFAEHGGAGVVLRFGQFYGFDSAHTVEAIGAVGQGAPCELGPESAYRSVITTDDAASAVVAALDAPSGVYNVVDDQPLTRAEYVDALAEALDVPPPAVRSVDLEPSPGVAVVLRSQRVSNKRFEEVTGWRPRFPSARQGWPFVVGQWRDHQAV